jgi:hypothetical protein
MALSGIFTTTGGSAFETHPAINMTTEIKIAPRNLMNAPQKERWLLLPNDSMIRKGEQHKVIRFV